MIEKALLYIILSELMKRIRNKKLKLIGNMTFVDFIKFMKINHLNQPLFPMN